MGRKNWKSEKIFERLINNKTEKTYWANISELLRRVNDHVYYQAYEFAASKNDKNKIIGIDVLAQLGHNPRLRQKETIKLYFELLETLQSDDVLYSLFISISHNNEILTENQIFKLIEYKNHKNKDVRYSLVSAISGIDNITAIDTLIELSEDKFASIRNWSTFGIGSLNEMNNNRIIKALWKRTKDKHQETKYEAIVGLAIRKDPRIKNIILEELKNGDYTTLLFDAMMELNDNDFLPYLKKDYKITVKNPDTNKIWLDKLKECIDKLKE